jgi:hypothetical protein
MGDPSTCRRRWSPLFWCSVGRSLTLLSVTHETLDKVHVLCNDGIIYAMTMEVSEERGPRWVDASGCEPFLCVVAHMSDMDE